MPAIRNAIAILAITLLAGQANAVEPTRIGQSVPVYTIQNIPTYTLSSQAPVTLSGASTASNRLSSSYLGDTVRGIGTTAINTAIDATRSEIRSRIIQRINAQIPEFHF